ncbi:neuronal acetylcholine receptor subunit beta-3-like isoform X2 [Lineus longissimus]|uniref:neuronal acetylcholine receptor subunit beta-3-like isoform X2 n=1 Tax=Lineus longissimus TaxID=88925 RepID=UPI00315DC44B
MDAKEQSVSISAYMEVKWLEPRFEWNPADYDGVSKVVVDANDLWIPDVGLVNSLDGDFDFSKSKPFRILVESDGTARWFPGGIFRVPCPLDLTYFPFDEQNCTFILSSWSYNALALKLRTVTGTMTVETMVSQTEWGVGEVSIHAMDRQPDLSTGFQNSAFSFLFISLTSARDPMFYITNIIIPAIIISLLVLTVFFLPCESGEKVSLGVTILLAFTVFQLVVAETLPPNTKATPLVVIYLTVLMTTTAISTVVSVIVLNLYHMQSETRIPGCVRVFIYDVLAKIICYRTFHRLKSSENLSDQSESVPADDMDKTNYINNILGGKVKNEETEIMMEGNSDGEIAALLKDIANVVQRMDERRHERHLETEILSEWKEAADVVDRFLMLVYFIAVLCITVAFLLIISGGK